MGTGDHFNNRTFTPPTPVQTGNPRQCTVAIEYQAHLRRAEEQVIAAVVRHQKAEAITVTADAAENQVKFVHRGIGATPGIDQLAITLHGA